MPKEILRKFNAVISRRNYVGVLRKEEAPKCDVRENGVDTSLNQYTNVVLHYSETVFTSDFVSANNLVSSPTQSQSNELCEGCVIISTSNANGILETFLCILIGV